jgi:hypothetical protein
MNTLYFDVDGVLFDFNEPFVEFWNDGLVENYWIGGEIVKNPTTWSFGLDKDNDNMSQLHKAIKKFDNSNYLLPLIDKDIPYILLKLKEKYRIELVTSYPNVNHRINNLQYHNLPYDKLTCNVTNKLDYVCNSEKLGYNVVAIFEDAPHHIDNYLTKYPFKIWAPKEFNYLKHYSTNNKVKLYESCQEWLTLL